MKCPNIKIYKCSDGFVTDNAQVAKSHETNIKSNKLKCPFCQQELEKRHAATTDYNSMFITYYCRNPECESTTDLIGCKEFWDILGQLIRTHKALEIAVDALDAGKTLADIAGFKILVAGLDKALEQITALEQKDK